MSGKRLALIIASSQFEDKDLSQLIAPTQDAEELARVLGNPEIGNFEVQTLVNRSRDEVGKAIETFFQDRRRDDLLLLYYSGHGIKDENGQLYFAVPNTQRNLLRSTAIPSRLLQDVMEDSRSRRQVLILDCCYSGAFTKGLRSRDDRQIGTKERFEGHGRVILTASDNMQYAFEGDNLTGEGVQSVFTSSLIKGLETWSADLNEDGEIDLEELYDYVYAEVRDKTTKMSPRRWSDVEGDIVIARNPAWVSKPYHNIKLEKQLDQLYLEGSSAFWTEEWENARRIFREIVKLQPGYKDAAEKLQKIEQKISFSERYEKAQAEKQTKNYQAALEILEPLHQQEPEHKELDSLLREVRKLVQAEKLYDEATQLFEAKQWLAAIKVFERIISILPDYEDVENLLSKARVFLSEQEREEKLNTLYRDALQAMDVGNWEEAQKLLLQVQKENPQYRDLKKLLSRVETELLRAQAETTTDQFVNQKQEPKMERWQKVPRSAWVGGGFIGIIVVFLILLSMASPNGILGSENSTATSTITPSKTNLSTNETLLQNTTAPSIEADTPTPTATLTPKNTPIPPTKTKTPSPTPSIPGRIFFVSTRNGVDGIYSMNGIGTDVQLVLELPDGYTVDSSVTTQFGISTDGNKLAFVDGKKQDARGFTLGYEILNLVNLTKSTQEITPVQINSHGYLPPIWFPDGKKLLLQSDKDGNTALFTINEDGSEILRIKYFIDSLRFFDISPDGKKIVFDVLFSTNCYYYYDCKFDVFIMDSDGQNSNWLGQFPDPVTGYAWSPDSKTIAISAGSLFVFSVNDSGISTDKISNYSIGAGGGVWGGGVVWHPNNTTLLFISNNYSGIGGVYSIEADGTNLQELTNDTDVYTYNELLITNDGEYIFFNRHKGNPGDTAGTYTRGQTDIFRMDQDGSNLINLTNSDQEEYLIGWAP